MPDLSGKTHLCLISHVTSVQTNGRRQVHSPLPNFIVWDNNTLEHRYRGTHTALKYCPTVFLFISRQFCITSVHRHPTFDLLCMAHVCVGLSYPLGVHSTSLSEFVIPAPHLLNLIGGVGPRSLPSDLLQ